MNPDEFVEQLLNVVLPDDLIVPQFDEDEQADVVGCLRNQFVKALREGAKKAESCTNRTYWLAEQTGVLAYRALALRFDMQLLSLVYGRYKEALPKLEAAKQIYQQLGDELRQARVDVSGILTIAHTKGGYDVSVARARQAEQILQKYQQWRSLATLNNNLAVVHIRYGYFSSALDALNVARTSYEALGEKGEPYLTNVDSNRSYVLYILGNYRESIVVAQSALDRANRLQQYALMLRCQQNLSIPYYGVGDYQRAAELLDVAQDGWLAEKRYHELIQTKLANTNNLLKLCRFHDVLSESQNVRELMAAHDIYPDISWELFNEVIALIALERYEEAADSLHAIRNVLCKDETRWTQFYLELTALKLLLRQKQPQSCEKRALNLIPDLVAANERSAIVETCFVAAEAAVAQDKWVQAIQYVEHGLQHASEAPYFVYEAHCLLGKIYKHQQQLDKAFVAFQTALETLEHLQKRVMIEHRPHFLDDKTKKRLYGDLVSLSLAKNDSRAALHYVERSRSRALHDIVANRVDLTVRALTPRDQPLVEEFNALNQEHQQLLRQQEQLTEQDELNMLYARQQQVEHDLKFVWHKLLIRNRTYAQMEIVPMVEEMMTINVPQDAILIEYYILDDQPVVFILSAEHPEPTVYHLPTTHQKINKLYRDFQLNLRLVKRSSAAQFPALLANIQGILRQLYTLLVAPFAADLQQSKRLIIVPHDTLHYLPFHAFMTDDGYLIETYPISYLPAASFLNLFTTSLHKKNGMLSVGYSAGNKLPSAVAEAQSVTTHWPHRLLLESDATVDTVSHLASQFNIIHFATHGVFRADNPLFSGLQFEDGWLTTLDIFNLQLEADLVTLSACSTGRTTIGGGDELLGLTRAFMAAGTSALIMTHWPVVDDITHQLISILYEQLAQGQTKDHALHIAQSRFLQEAREAKSIYQHPYFWSPFFLVGATNPVI